MDKMGRVALPRLHLRRIGRRRIDQSPDDARDGETEHSQSRRRMKHQHQEPDRRRPAFHEEANAKVGHIMDAASHETANYSPKLYKAWKWWRRVNELTPRNP